MWFRTNRSDLCSKEAAMKSRECRTLLVTIFGCLVSISLFASQDTIGPNGINSAGLRDACPQHNLLTGDGIAIGQMEAARPGKDRVDTVANCCNSFIVPTGVYFQDMDADANQKINQNGHAHWVAGIMISTDTVVREGNMSAAVGVAPQDDLHSSAFTHPPRQAPVRICKSRPPASQPVENNRPLVVASPIVV